MCVKELKGTFYGRAGSRDALGPEDVFYHACNLVFANFDVGVFEDVLFVDVDLVARSLVPVSLVAVVLSEGFESTLHNFYIILHVGICLRNEAENNGVDRLEHETLGQVAVSLAHESLDEGQGLC